MLVLRFSEFSRSSCCILGEFAQYTEDKSLRIVNLHALGSLFVRDFVSYYNNLKDLWLTTTTTHPLRRIQILFSELKRSLRNLFRMCQNHGWQERVSTLLNMYGVATALTSSKPNSNIASKQVED